LLYIYVVRTQYIKRFEAFIDKNGTLNALSRNITISTDIFDFDLYNIDFNDSDLNYIEGKIYIKPQTSDYVGTIIYDKTLDKFFSEFEPEFYNDVKSNNYNDDLEKLYVEIKKDLVR